MKDDASKHSFAYGARGGFLAYLNLHIAEQRPAVQQLVVLPAPANLPHAALPGRRRGGVWCSSPQVTEVTCGLRWWWGAHTDVLGEIIWSRPVVSNSIRALLEDMWEKKVKNKAGWSWVFYSTLRFYRCREKFRKRTKERFQSSSSHRHSDGKSRFCDSHNIFWSVTEKQCCCLEAFSFTAEVALEVWRAQNQFGKNITLIPF